MTNVLQISELDHALVKNLANSADIVCMFERKSIVLFGMYFWTSNKAKEVKVGPFTSIINVPVILDNNKKNCTCTSQMLFILYNVVLLKRKATYSVWHALTSSSFRSMKLLFAFLCATYLCWPVCSFARLNQPPRTPCQTV